MVMLIGFSFGLYRETYSGICQTKQVSGYDGAPHDELTHAEEINGL